MINNKVTKSVKQLLKVTIVNKRCTRRLQTSSSRSFPPHMLTYTQMNTPPWTWGVSPSCNDEESFRTFLDLDGKPEHHQNFRICPPAHYQHFLKISWNHLIHFWVNLPQVRQTNKRRLSNNLLGEVNNSNFSLWKAHSSTGGWHQLRSFLKIWHPSMWYPVTSMKKKRKKQ